MKKANDYLERAPNASVGVHKYRAKTRDDIIIENVLRMSGEKGWTNVLLAEKAGTSPQHFNSIKKGRRGVGKRLLKRFADALNVSEAVLLIDRMEVNNRKSGPIPVFNNDEANLIRAFVSSGGLLTPAVKEKNRMSVNALRKVGKNAFGIRVTDHSMAPKFVPDDIAIVDPDETDETENAIFAIYIGGVVILRRIRRIGSEIRIVADAGGEPDIILKDSGSLVIVGKAIELYREL